MHAAKLLRLAKNWWMVYVRIQIALTTFDFRLCCYTLCFFCTMHFFSWLVPHHLIYETRKNCEHIRWWWWWWERWPRMNGEKKQMKNCNKTHPSVCYATHKIYKRQILHRLTCKKKKSSFCVKSSPNLSHYSFGVVRFRDNFCFHIPFACIHCALRDLWSSR